VSDYVDPAFLVDNTLAEGRELREQIVRAMQERRANVMPIDRPPFPQRR
jgi:hypothetical protein